MGSTGCRGAGRFISVKYGQTCHHLFSGKNRSSPNGLQKSRKTNYPAVSVSPFLIDGLLCSSQTALRIAPPSSYETPNRSDRNKKAFLSQLGYESHSQVEIFLWNASYADMNYATLTQCHMKTLTKCHSLHKWEVIQMENI